jgi:hypothetical protein
MANLIQIKRSLSTSTPGSLANGELAYTANGDVLFVGSNSVVVPIGGKRTPGILTANQALVANSTGGIDKILVANLSPTKVYANGSHGTAGQVLVSDGANVYWGTGTSGSNTQLQFNDSGVANASPGLTFDKNTNTLFVANTLTIGTATINSTYYSGSVNNSTYILANNGLISNSSGVFVNGNNGIVVNTAGLFVNANNGVVANSSGVFVVAANGIIVTSSGVNVNAFDGLISNQTGLYVIGGAGIVSNTSGVYANVDNSTIGLIGGALVVKDNGIQLGTKTTGDYVANVVAGVGLSGSVSGESATASLAVVANSGIIANTSGVFVNGNTGVTVNAAGVFIGQPVGTTDNVTFNDLTTNGNTIIGSSSGDVVSIKAGVNTSIIPSANATYDLGTDTVRWKDVYAQNVHATTGYFEGDVSVGGDIVVAGNLVTVNVSSVVVSDPLIYLAGNNYISDLVDIGFVGNYYDGSVQRHAGVLRHAATDEFYIFKNYDQEPTLNTVNVADPSFVLADLNVYLKSGGLTSNSGAVTITANSTVNVNITANTLSLTTPLSGTSGGLGLNSFTSEDILVANTSNGFRKLSLGNDGYVLQSNGTAVIYATLDGGVF